MSQLRNQSSAFNVDLRNSVVCIATDLHDCDYKSNRKDIQLTELQNASPVSKHDTAFNFGLENIDGNLAESPNITAVNFGVSNDSIDTPTGKPQKTL